MKPPSEEHDLIRWLDGEMTAPERVAFEQRLEHDAALAKEARELRALSVGLRTHLPAEMSVPHADFFNSQIQVRIAQMDLDQARSQQTGSSWASLLLWLRQPQFAAACAVALAVLGFVLLRPSSDVAVESLILSSYTPDARVQAHAFHDSAAEATVLMLEGLDAIPAEKKVSGIDVHRSEMEPEVASTTLYDTQDAPVLMISRDASGKPLISPRG
jgi:anti-sigma-K factor RskA